MAIRLTKNTMCEDCSVKQASFGTEDERKARWCGPCGGSHGAIRLSKHAMELKYARKAARKSGNEAEVESALSKKAARKVEVKEEVKPPPPVEPPLSRKSAEVTKDSARKVTKNQAANKRHLGGAHTVKKAIAKKKR
jgi:hypothetical protein